MADYSLLGFAAKLTELGVAVHEESEHALERAATLVERSAKARLGTYQDAAGGFAGWAELADSTKEDRLRQGYSENDPGLRSGEMRGSIEHTVEMHGFDGDAYVGSDDEKLVWFELGTEKQPPRSDLGGALFENADAVAEIIGSSIYGALIGDEVHNNEIPLING